MYLFGLDDFVICFSLGVYVFLLISSFMYFVPYIRCIKLLWNFDTRGTYTWSIKKNLYMVQYGMGCELVWGRNKGKRESKEILRLDFGVIYAKEVEKL